MSLIPKKLHRVWDDDKIKKQRKGGNVFGATKVGLDKQQTELCHMSQESNCMEVMEFLFAQERLMQSTLLNIKSCS